jgi:hypothetical protein
MEVEPLTKLDLLPAELVLNICKYLPTRDISSVAQLSSRLDAILRSCPVLSLHFVPGEKLLHQVAHNKDTRRSVASNVFLQKKLNIELSFFRSVTDIAWDTTDDVADANFVFTSWRGSNEVQHTESVVKIVQSSYDPMYYQGLRRMVLLIADDDMEAIRFDNALRQAGLESHLIRNHLTKSTLEPWLWKRNKFVVVVPQLPKMLAANLTKMAAVISCRKMTSVHSFLEVESFAPGQTVYVMHAVPEDFRVLDRILEYMEPHIRPPFNRQTRLEIRRGLYTALASMSWLS